MITVHPELRRALHEARSREASASARPRRLRGDRSVTRALGRVPRPIAGAVTAARDVMAGRDASPVPVTVPERGGLR